MTPTPPLLANRTWPDNHITQPPVWCSVDLRAQQAQSDQVLPVADRIVLFHQLVQTGFTHIDVGFPANSPADYQFVRALITQQLIPENIQLQVMSFPEPGHINQTCAAVQGCAHPILHVYHADNQLNPEALIAAIRQIKDWQRDTRTAVTLGYSAERFIHTDPGQILSLFQTVISEWTPTAQSPLILNMPCIAGTFTINVLADRIEWIKNQLQMAHVTLSLHSTNSRNTAVACAELALLAGVTRLEGALIAHSAFSRNLDVVALSLNLQKLGVEPGLNFNLLPAFRDQFIPDSENQIYPYWHHANPASRAALHPEYAQALEKHRGYHLPAALKTTFCEWVTQAQPGMETALDAAAVCELFEAQVMNLDSPIQFAKIHYFPVNETECAVRLDLNFEHSPYRLNGTGTGPVDAACSALSSLNGLPKFEVAVYFEHSLDDGAAARAIAYIQLRLVDTQTTVWGAGIDRSITTASVKAVLAALNAWFLAQMPAPHYPRA